MSKPIRAILLAIACMITTACEVELYSELSEREANEMLAILIANDIQGSKEIAKDKTSSLKVEEADFSKAVQLLQRNGLPRANFGNIGEIFKKEGLISSPMEERARFIYALGQELSETISQIDGVLSARVHVVVPENFSPLERPVPSSASVFIRHKPGASVSTLTTQIKLLVTNSIEGLVYDKVSIALFPADGLEADYAATNSGSDGRIAMRSGNTRAPTSDFTRVAGLFWVHKSSAGSLLMTLYALAGIALLAVIILLLVVFSRDNAIPVARRS